MKKEMEDNNIPYEEIDPEMREFIYLLNFVWRIKTRFCCIGEKEKFDSYIMFDYDVTDDEILKLHEYLKPLNTFEKNPNKFFRFEKWLRVGYNFSTKKEETLMTWAWRANKGKNIKFKKEFVNKICEKIKKDYNLI